jgi:hypothetical protein
LESGKRPDILASIGTTRLYIDVSVRHPCAPSYIAEAAKKELSAAMVAEVQKKRLYEERARLDRAEFEPFALETYGGFGECARDVVARVAGFADNAGPCLWSKSEVSRMMISHVAIAVQRGNAMCALTGYVERKHRRA